jgi:PAS domain S-box-containing protein
MRKDDLLKDRLEELFSSDTIDDGAVEENQRELKPSQESVVKPRANTQSSRESEESLAAKRTRELNYLNEIGLRIDEKPPIPEFLDWVARLIPSAMFHQDIATAAITYKQETYGDETAINLPSKIVAGIRIVNELVGYVHIAYRKDLPFRDEESAFLGAVAGRIASFLENEYLFSQMELRSKELMKFKKGIDLSTDAVFITDLNGTITYANDAFEKVYGFTQEEVLGNTPRLIKSGLIPQEQYKYFWETLLSGGIVAGEIFNKTKDGSIIPIEGANIPILDENNVLVGFLAIHRDVSKRKHDEQLLKKRADGLEAVSRLSTTISAILNPDRLLQTVVDLSKEMLQLYHAQVYLLDEKDEMLILSSGSGETGQKMVDLGWRIEIHNPSSIVARAAREKTGLLVNNVQKAEGYLPNPLLPNTKSELAVPIIIGETLLGILDVQSDQLDYFTPEDISVQTSLAGQIAVALQNARLYQETQNALDKSAALLAISQAASYSQESKEILSQALEKILKFTGYDCGLISMLDSKDRQLKLAVYHQLPEKMVHRLTTLGLSGTLCDYVFKQNDIVIIDDFSQGGPIDVSGMIALGLHSYYGAPLRSREGTNGTLCIFGYQPNTRRKEADQIITAASQQIGIAVENALLFRETQEALAQSEVLYQGSASIVRSSSDEELLDAIIATTSAKQFDQAFLFKFDQPWLSKPPELISVAASWEKNGSAKALSVNEARELIHISFTELGTPQKPLYVHDLTENPHILDLIQKQHVKPPELSSFAVFPLITRNECIGALILQSFIKTNISDVEFRKIFSLIGQAAPVMRSLQLRSDLENQIQVMANLQRLLSREAWVSYLSKSHQKQIGYEYDLAEISPLSSEIIKSITVNNSPSQTNISDRHFKTYTTSLEIQGEKIGNLGIFDPEIIELSEEEQQFLQSAADQVAQALERARLVEQTHKIAVELQTVAQLSSTSSTTLDPDELLQTVVDLAKNSFGLYHAHIYLLDDSETKLILHSGSGDIGRKMSKEGWIIFLNEDSIVAKTANTRMGQIVNDVHGNPDFLPNPLLPNTASELAVPMIVGQNLLGVFDVQSETLNYFTEEDMQTYLTLATQTAVALQNARLFAEQSVTVERLRELDHLKTSFLANMSHELRTPLNSILGFTQVILEGIDGPLTDYMISDLQLIEKNGKHLLNLISEVLDMAKIEAGRMSLTIENLDLRELLGDVLETTSAQAREKGIYLDLKADSHADLGIAGDQIRLKQIMLNLISNAIKFTETGGITVEAERKIDEIHVRVVDTGIGIAQDKLETIFEAFSQVDTSTTRKAGGTGLGLPISRRLVEMHGGRLWAVSSGEGKGTVMHLTLPIQAKMS